MASKVETLDGSLPGAGTRGAAIRRWFELCLVLLIAFGIYFPNSVYSLRHRHNLFLYKQDAILGLCIGQEIVSVALLGYVMSRRNIRWRGLGLRWSVRDVLSGLVVALASYAGYWTTYHGLLAIHDMFLPGMAFIPEPSAPFGRPPFIKVAFYLLNPFFEELIVRAYLMTEVQVLTGSWALAVGLSTVIQASYHIYYGWMVTIALAIQFLMFSIYYARTRSATPLIVAHGMFDWSWLLLGVI